VHAIHSSLVVLALALPCAAQKEASQSVQEELQALVADWDEAEAAFNEELEAIPRAERREYHQKHRPDPAHWTPRFFELAEKSAGTDAALTALVWIGEKDGQGENGTKVLAAVAKDFADAAGAGKILSSVPVTPDTKPLFEKVRRTSKLAGNRGLAVAALAKRAKELYDLGVIYAGPPPDDVEAYYRQFYGDELCDEVEKAGWKPYAEEARELFATLVAEHADLAGDDAQRNLFELESLTPGSIAPEIEGEDLDGVAFRLSDYRGKVVVLDFWGDW